MLADAGYFSADNVTAVTEAGMDPLLATGRLKHGEQPPPAPRGRIPKDLTPKQRMTRKLQTPKGKADYARRKAIVEPVFGQMKSRRRPNSSGYEAPTRPTMNGLCTPSATTSGATMFSAAFRGTAPSEQADNSDLVAAFPKAMTELQQAVHSPGALDRTIAAPFGDIPGDAFARFVALDSSSADGTSPPHWASCTHRPRPWWQRSMPLPGAPSPRR